MKTKEDLRRKILECNYIDEIMQAINDYEASLGHYKISPLKDKPGFYAVDEPDFNVVMAVFKGEKEIAEGEWYLINAKEQKQDKEICVRDSNFICTINCKFHQLCVDCALYRK